MNQQQKRGPLSWVPSVYFGMGLPYVALSLVSVLIFKDLGIDDERITFWTSLLVLPWSFKPVFSLLMELLGTKRQYVIMTEAISALMFGLLAFTLLPALGLSLNSIFMGAIAIMGVIAFSGSMHDIAGDGIYMQELSAAEQGRWSGWQGAFYNLAKILTNGALVFLAGYLGRSIGLQKAWMIIMGICALLMLGLALYHMLALPRSPKRYASPSHREALQELWTVIVSFFQKPYIWLYLLFIFVYRFAEGLAMKVAPLFLKAGTGEGGLAMSNEQYGIIYGSAGALAFVLGSICSGYFIGHFGLKRVLSTLVLIFNVPFAVYYLLALYQPSSLVWIATGIVFEYFSYGFGFVGITLFMMQQVAPGKYQMAHYAFANSLMNLSVLVPGAISGWLSSRLGYEIYFLVVLAASLPAIVMSFFLPFAHTAEGDGGDTR